MKQRAIVLIVSILTIAFPSRSATNGALRAGILMIDDMERARMPQQVATNNAGNSIHPAPGDLLIIDDMEKEQNRATNALANSNPISGESSQSWESNSLGAKTGVYQQEPSQAEATKAAEYGKNGAGLRIYYNKRNKGGPRGDGGVCGYYSLLHSGPDDYLDASSYRYLVFWVRGAKGSERFKLGVADRKWHELDDSVKSKDIGVYLPSGKITPEWQLAVIPMADFPVDWRQAHAIAICFESDLFDNGAGSGVVFIDDILFSKERPAPMPEMNEQRLRNSKPAPSKQKHDQKRDKRTNDLSDSQPGRKAA
jgi:hypothetical protein